MGVKSYIIIYNNILYAHARVSAFNLISAFSFASAVEDATVFAVETLSGNSFLPAQRYVRATVEFGSEGFPRLSAECLGVW